MYMSVYTCIIQTSFLTYLLTYLLCASQSKTTSPPSKSIAKATFGFSASKIPSNKAVRTLSANLLISLDVIVAAPMHLHPGPWVSFVGVRVEDSWAVQPVDGRWIIGIFGRREGGGKMREKVEVKVKMRWRVLVVCFFDGFTFPLLYSCLLDMVC
ncbi:hypothetical protein GGS20DRAFT_543187 [Poronia punctata]|nr:hypothetical protein GGS20DRAFT_543187 [Poronia punctata]